MKAVAAAVHRPEQFLALPVVTDGPTDVLDA
jgi:hypothetical protein